MMFKRNNWRAQRRLTIFATLGCLLAITLRDLIFAN